MAKKEVKERGRHSKAGKVAKGTKSREDREEVDVDPTKDTRFSRVSVDPRFRSMRRTVRQVNIDGRFKKMFEDEEFVAPRIVDKYGRSEKRSAAKEDLKSFYRLEDEEKKETDVNEERKDSDVSDEEELGKDIAEIGSDSDQDEEMISATTALEEVEYEEELVDPTSRLAVLNLDWDHVNAVDLFVLFNSFTPSGGALKSVTVYLSDLGAKALKGKDAPDVFKKSVPSPKKGSSREEELAGTTMLASSKANGTEDIEGPGFDKEKLRQYELDRLRYHFAIIEADTAQTAGDLMVSMVGLELELSSNVLDIRYVPGDMEFDNDVRDTATEMPVEYTPLRFHTKALQMTNLSLSWDTTEPDRARAFSKIVHMSKDELNANDLDVYLASASEDEGDENKEMLGGKYKQLLSMARKDDDDGEGSDEGEGKDRGLVVSFVPPLQDSEDEEKGSDSGGDGNPESGEIGEEDDGKTVWERVQEKQREKKRQKKAERREKRRLALEEREKESKGKKGKRKREDIPKKTSDGELALMVLPDSEKSAKDDFEIDVKDARFSSLFSSSEFHIDPADKQFKKTEGMGKLVQERQRQRSILQENNETEAREQLRKKRKK